jgi:RHS repeat-associated protein
MNLLALALLQSLSFGASVAQPAAPALAVAPRAAAVEAVVVVPTLDAQAQLATAASVAATPDEYPTAWPRVFEDRAPGKYFGARYYSSPQGRFTTPDAPFADQYEEDPQSWNLYSYTRNNPLKYVDDDGRALKVIVSGFKLLVKGGDVASTFAGVTEAVAIIASGNPAVGTGARLLAVGSLLGEVSGVSDVLKGGKAALKVVDGVGDAKKVAGRVDTLKPGPFAVESIPAHRGRPTAPEQRTVNGLMTEHGCHTCGTKNPGTKSGNAIADHQPAQALGEPEIFLPHCNTCKAIQGGQVLQELRKLKPEK